MDDVEDAFVFVYDRRRGKNEERRKIHIGGVFSFDVFLEKVLDVFELASDDEFIVTTTGREEINDDDTFVTLIESGDTLYLLQYVDQPLEAPVAEHIEYQPHYDTLIKSGIYEYYASEGNMNPLPFAFAELIDNALAATAKNIGPRIIELSLHFNTSTGEHMLCVYDNGQGMSSRQLNNWAIYRLSKFNRKDRRDIGELPPYHDDENLATPKSLNSDISWFGVGGKQAIFFIGNSTRIITKQTNSCDVHEFTMSKNEFKRKEKNKEAIFAGYIRNRTFGDSSHIPHSDEVIRDFINSENDDSFTRVIVSGISENHTHFMKHGFDVWNRQLAHIYHYYIHGPEGNTSMSRNRKNIGVSDVNIMVTLHENGEKILSTNLRDIEDDLETKYIRTSANTFEFVAKSDGENGGIVEGMIRYHPFLYDRETYPIDSTQESSAEYDGTGEPPGRGRRPIFECYWNGRLIPYTFIDDFDWCKIPRKQAALLGDCFYRISGCLFSNDKFQVSTNKLTFIDLDSKLKDRNTIFNHMVLGEEQNGQINRHFVDWLKECHEKHDKQVKFLKHVSVVMKNDGTHKSKHTLYKAIEWEGRVFSKGQLVRTQRTVPIICGTIRKFLLPGEYDGDVYSVGGEFELVQEPQALFGEIRCFPLSKLDRNVSVEIIQDIVQREEGKLPATIEVEWPDNDEVTEGQVSFAGVNIGAMQAVILNQDDEPIHKLFSNNESRKLLVEQRIYLSPTSGEMSVQVSSHVTSHSKNGDYYFERIENLKAPGNYSVTVQAALDESGVYIYGDGRKLPSLTINFCIQESPPYRFMVGILESPLRIGCPFDLPLDMQDDNGHSTRPTFEVDPILESNGLELSYDSTEIKGNSLVIKDVVAIGDVMSQQGKNFQMKVIVPGLARESQTLKIRLLPGDPHSLAITAFNDGFKEIQFEQGTTELPEFLTFENSSNISLNVGVVDIAGNPTLKPRLTVQCKFSGSPGLPTWTCNCSNTGYGVIGGKIKLKHLKTEKKIQAKIEVQGSKEIAALQQKFILKPSSKICFLNVFYKKPLTSNNEEIQKLKRGQDMYFEAGETMTNISFQLLDEAKRIVLIDVSKHALNIQVNWTDEISSTDLENGLLPDIVIPTNVSDTRFCQVTYLGEKNVHFSFNIKPIAGQPAGIKVTIHGSRETRLGMIRREPISISLLDNFSNQLNIAPNQLDMVNVKAEGLDESILSKYIEGKCVVVSDIQFNQGPLGSKELVVSYGDDIQEYAVLQLIAGTPVTLQVKAWGDDPLPVLSGTRIRDPITVQLLDGWGNPSPENGVKVLLGKDPGLKLTPSAGVLKTNNDGFVAFQKFSFSGKCGEFWLQPRAIYNRRAMEGRKLFISLLPNTETPVSIQYQRSGQETTVTVGTPWPEYEVDILSEEETRVTTSVNLCLVIWKGKTKSDEIPSNAEWHRAVASNGHHSFHGIKSPTKVGEYCCVFCITEIIASKTATLTSEVFTMKTVPGVPKCLLPSSEPGTPTVSNAHVAVNRILIRNLKLQLMDGMGNLCNDDTKCNISVTIQPCDQTLKCSETPMFVGNASRLFVPIRKGEALLQNLTLQENSPGIDGSQYILHCEIQNDERNIQPYMLKFLFYNDAKKYAQMSELVQQRDVLLHAVKMYEETFSAHKTLFDEIKQGCAEADKKKTNLIHDLQKLGLSISSSCQSCDISQLIEDCSLRRNSLMHDDKRKCLLPEYQDGSSEVLGKIGHLALISDDDAACVLSWHMSADMDCLVTFTTKKAREIHKLSDGRQQVLPIDSIYKKNLSDWKKQLPHVKARISQDQVTGNPIFARKLLNFQKDQVNCRMIFTMLLGDTILIDDLDSANQYRNMVVKHTHCPTILTRNGHRIRSNGKFGGNQNRAPAVEKLRGMVFGAPMSEEYSTCVKQIEILKNIKSVIEEIHSSQEELESLQLETDEMKFKEQEHKEAQERLNAIEKKIGFHKPQRRSLPEPTRQTRKRFKKS
ncbi:structural maintenance of chromosomes flexible hinge domain-containing protein 1-like isoform X3 [Ciona intestinalis]